MRERREIAAGADRTLFRNDRMHAPIQHLAKHLNDLEPNTAEAERKHVCAQQHHCANFGLRKRLTDSTGVAANEIELKIAQGVARNAEERRVGKECRTW